MTEQERYEQIDLPFYRTQILPILPPAVLDFHVHTWRREHWKEITWETNEAGAQYMVTEEQYSVEELRADMRRLFPETDYQAVCFGMPHPTIDLPLTNAACAEARRYPELYPLLIAGRDLLPREELERTIREGGFFGYKVFLNWLGDNYGDIALEDMLGPVEMDVANELGLVIMWHVPRSGRLADPVVRDGVVSFAKQYPNARIVLAHCGRCYLPDEMQAAIGPIVDLENVYLDTTMVMDPTVLEIVFDHIDSSRVVYGTDMPIANMRGRRVYVMDHWVDVVLEGYPPSAYRLASNDIHATFMVYEIILAIRRAAERTGLTREQLHGIFYENGMGLLRRVMNGAQMQQRAGV